MIEKAIEKLNIILQGRIPEKIDTENISNEKEQELSVLLNNLFNFMQEIHEFITPLSKGRLDEIKLPSPKNFMGSPFKELHSRLLNLTWQAKQVAQGDYNQRVDFMGDFSDAFNSMIISLDNNEKMLKGKIEELENALSRIKKLEGILPICAKCKKIRDDEGYWQRLDQYITEHSEVVFSHGMCKQCSDEMYGGEEWYEEAKKKGEIKFS